MRQGMTGRYLALIAIAATLASCTPKDGPSTLRAGFDAEFLTRPDGYEGLCEHYGFRFPDEPKQMDPGLMYKAAADGAVDVICAFATDGRIRAYGLQTLEDDQKFFPPYYTAPLVRQEVLDEYPEVAQTLDRLAGNIDDATMQALNYEVDEEGRKAADVARAFLISQRLISEDAKPRPGTAGTLTVGGKQFTEQEILGELMAILVESTCDIRVTRKLNLGGTMICFTGLKSGDLDLYAEYTGTALVNLLKKDVINDPDEAYDAVKATLKSEYGLILLRPFGFNNTYTLTMRDGQAKELGIRTISDLARLLAAEE